MAGYNDMGSFNPSESAYVNPGEYEASQRNIALQKGTYMADMDARYAAINEQARQFDAGLGLEERKFDFSSELQTGQFLESIRQFDVGAALESRKISQSDRRLDIAQFGAESQDAYYSQLGKSQEHDRTFDWIGLGIEAFREGGLIDSLL